MSDAAASSLGGKLEALYQDLPAEERQIVDFLLTQAAAHIVEKGDVQGYGLASAGDVGGDAGTQDAMKRVLFGAAGVTGGLASPGAINWLVASARDAQLFS